MAVLVIGNEGGNIPQGYMRKVCSKKLGNPGNGGRPVPPGNKSPKFVPLRPRPRTGRWEGHQPPESLSLWGISNIYTRFCNNLKISVLKIKAKVNKIICQNACQILKNMIKYFCFKNRKVKSLLTKQRVG